MVDYSGVAGGDNAAAAAAAGRFLSNLQNSGVALAELDHKLDPYRVEYFDKESIFDLDTTTKR